METMYSTTQAGYQAWLADGNVGTFENFLEAQVKVTDKQHLIEKIVTELKEMSLSDLKEILGNIRNRNF